jgi:hypothetical protein
VADSITSFPDNHRYLVFTAILTSRAECCNGGYCSVGVSLGIDIDVVLDFVFEIGSSSHLGITRCTVDCLSFVYIAAQIPNLSGQSSCDQST